MILEHRLTDIGITLISNSFSALVILAGASLLEIMIQAMIHFLGMKKGETLEFQRISPVGRADRI